MIITNKHGLKISHPANRQRRYGMLLRKLLLCLLLLPVTVTQAATAEQIFILHSYSQEYPWSRAQHSGFTRQFLANTERQALFSTEYLDTKRISYNKAYADFFAQYLKQKYSNYQPGLVYVSDDNALAFANDYLADMFPQAVIIFSGVNDYPILDRLDPSRFTGVFEKKEIIPNIELLKMLDPDASEILVVGDGSNTYQAIEQEIKQQLNKRPDISATYIASQSIEQLTAELALCKQKYLILTTIGSITDKNGSQLSLPEITARIAAAGDFVIISMEDGYLLDGVMGGYVTSGKQQGQTAASLALAYQQGGDIRQLQAVTDSPNRYIFDYRELARHQLTLPAAILDASILLHRPPSFYEKNRELILASIVVLTALLLLSMAIFLNILTRKNRKIQCTADEMSQQAQALELTKSALTDAQRLAKVGSWDLDLLTNTLIWSDEIFRTFEVDQAKFAATYEAFLNAIHPDDRAMVNKAYADSLVNRQPYEIRHRLLMRDGSIKYVNESCESFFDDDGKPLRSVGTVQDISELHRAEQEIGWLASIVKHSQDFIGIADMEGRPLFINAAGRELVGISDDEYLRNTRVADYFPAGDSEFVVNEIMPAVLKNGRWFGEVHFRHFISGECIPVWFDIFRIDNPVTDQPVNYATITRDLRAQKATEAELDTYRNHLEELVHARTAELELARDEAERANAAKSEFLSRMSHELRTPMNAILGFGQILEMDSSGFNDIQRDNIREILTAGDHLLTLINDVLDLARIESGKMQTSMETVVIADVLQQSLALIRTQAAARQLELVDNISHKGYRVQADFSRLKQVLVNLLSNAVKYNRDHGRIVLEAAVINPQRLRISVTDSGYGLSAEDMTKLFTAFERLHALHSTDGVGIGLMITKHLIEIMGGAIGVESKEGEGSSFWVEIALAADVIA